MKVLKFIQPKLKALSNGLFANWMPGDVVDVGDFGVVVNGQFNRQGSIRDYGAEFDVAEGPASSSELEYKDKLEIEVNALAAATAAPGQGAKVKLNLTDKGSFLYHLSNTRQCRPSNMRVFNEEVARILLGEAIPFPKNGVLITELQRAGHATIIVSEEQGGQLELSTDFKPGGAAFLSGASGNVSTSFSRGSLFSFIGQTETTALVKIVIPKITPPTGPGTGVAARAVKIIEDLKDWMRERQIGAQHLRISGDLQAQDGVVIAFEQQDERFTLKLDDMTAMELMATIEEVQPDAITEDESFDLDIDEEEVAPRYGTATG